MTGRSHAEEVTRIILKQYSILFDLLPSLSSSSPLLRTPGPPWVTSHIQLFLPLPQVYSNIQLFNLPLLSFPHPKPSLPHLPSLSLFQHRTLPYPPSPLRSVPISNTSLPLTPLPPSTPSFSFLLQFEKTHIRTDST